MRQVINLIFIFLSILLGVAGQILMKTGVNKVKNALGGKDLTSFNELLKFYLKVAFSLEVIGGILSYAISVIIWLWVLSRVELSYARPLVGIGYILVAIYAYYFMGENVTLVRWAGIILISLGVFLVTKS